MIDVEFKNNVLVKKDNTPVNLQDEIFHQKCKQVYLQDESFRLHWLHTGKECR